MRQLRTQLLLGLLAASMLALLPGCRSDDADNTPDNMPIPVEPDDGIGDGAEPLPVLIGEELAPQLLGLSQAQAEARLNTSGLVWRYVRIDDEPLAVTADFVPGRLNVSLVGGRVVGVQVEAGENFTR